MGIKALHEQEMDNKKIEIVHRDVKTLNFLVTKE